MVAPYNFHKDPDNPKLDSLNLQTVERGVAPKSRLSDPRKTQELGAKLIEAARERSRKNALLKGQLDGNRPYSQAKLRAAAQAWRTNVNFGEAKAAVSAALTPFYDLFTGSKWYFSIDTKFGSNAKERDDFSKAITEQANYHVQEWDGFDFNMQAMLFDMISFGKGFMFWLDKTDWRSEWIAQHLVYVPDSTKAHTSKLPLLMIRTEYQVHELWKKIENEKAADAVGWNVRYVKHAIENAYPANKASSSERLTYEAVQQRIKDNDIYEGMEADKVPVYQILVAEFNGKVSRLIVPESPLPSRDGQADTVEFLYENVGEYSSFAEAVATFFFETLDGSWNGANGLAKELYDAIEIKNRLKCTIVDSAFLRSSIVLQALDATSVDKASLIQIGAFSVVPPGFAIQNSTIMGDLQSPILCDRMLEATISGNIGIFRAKMDKPEGNPRTAKEVEINYQQGATLSNSAVNRFYLNLDRYYKELVRRLVKDKEFIARCEEYGIPKEALTKIVCVRAYRTVGNGSVFMRQQAQGRIAPLVPLMPEAGRIEWARDSVASELNQYAAARYFPDTQDDTLRTDHAYDATIENGLLKIGAPILITPKQNGIIHCQTHLQFAAAAAASLQNGANPLEVLNTLDAVGGHVTEHRARLSQDNFRGEELKAIDEQLGQLAKIADDLRKKIREQAEASQERAQMEQQAQAAEQGMDPEMRINAAKAAQDMAIKKEKADLANQLKIDAHNTKVALADAKAVSGIALAQAKQQAQEKQSQEKSE